MTTTTGVRPVARNAGPALPRREVEARLARVRAHLDRLARTSSMRDTLPQIRERNTQLLQRLRG